MEKSKGSITDGLIKKEGFDGKSPIRGHDEKTGIPVAKKETVSTDRGKFICKP